MYSLRNRLPATSISHSNKLKNMHFPKEMDSCIGPEWLNLTSRGKNRNLNKMHKIQPDLKWRHNGDSRPRWGLSGWIQYTSLDLNIHVVFSSQYKKNLLGDVVGCGFRSITLSPKMHGLGNPKTIRINMFNLSLYPNFNRTQKFRFLIYLFYLLYPSFFWCFSTNGHPYTMVLPFWMTKPLYSCSF